MSRQLAIAATLAMVSPKAEPTASVGPHAPQRNGRSCLAQRQLTPTTNELPEPTRTTSRADNSALVVSRWSLSKHRMNPWKVLKRQRLAPRRGRSILPRMGDLSSRAIRHVSRLSLGEQRDLLQDLTAPSIIRADAIRQFRERPDGQRMAELLMDLEADETLRVHVVDALRRSLASPGGQPEE
jgi:hypothetical protein